LALDKVFTGEWGLVLGASSGFGMATAKELASRGMNIFGVHFDRRSAMDKINQDIEEMKSHGVDVEYFNINAADEEKRLATVQAIKEQAGDKPCRMVLHSLAFGSLKAYAADTPDEEINQKQVEMTLDVMANSLVYWVQDLRRAGLIGKGSRIYGLTSSGGSRAWPFYGAVSAAKAALEAHIRQFAFEMGKEGVRANSICAGVTVTPALKKIPENENLISEATKRNPSGRMTTPEDVAKTIAILCLPEAEWINGSIIYVDGGENFVA
jgi:enoyl-[acyl-carrier protein] reductase III